MTIMIITRQLEDAVAQGACKQQPPQREDHIGNGREDVDLSHLQHALQIVHIIVLERPHGAARQVDSHLHVLLHSLREKRGGDKRVKLLDGFDS